MLALNNKLYLSHSLLKRRLTVQAVLSDIKDKSQVTAEQSQLARQMKESVYGFGQEWDYFINKKNVMKKPRLLNIDVIERSRLKDESSCFHYLMTQQKSYQVFVQKRWRIMKRLFFGTCGAWYDPSESLDMST